MASALMLVPVASTANALPDDISEARGTILHADLLNVDLAEVASSESAYPSVPDAQYDPLNLELIEEAIVLDLGTLDLPLINEDGTGLLDLGHLGAAHSYAEASSETSAISAAGAVSSNGAIALDSVSDQGPARVNLTALLEQLNVTDLTEDIVDEAVIELGALASRAEAGEGVTSRDYELAGAEVIVSSPLVGALTSDLGIAVEGLTADLDELAGGSTNLVSELVEVIDSLLPSTITGISVTGSVLSGLGDAGDIISTELLQGTISSPAYPEDGIAAGLVTLNLDDGDIRIDLSALGLNGHDANTQLLGDDMLPLVTRAITDTVATLVADLRTNLTDALDAITVDFEVNLTALGLLGLNIDVDGTLAGALGLTDTPLSVETNGTGLAWLLNILGINNLLNGLVLPAVNGLLGNILGTTLDDLLLGEDALVDALLAEVTGELIPVLEPTLSQLVSITVNEQGTSELSTHDADYVTALALTLLPSAQAAKVSLATSEVRAAAQASVIITQPSDGDRIPGDVVQVTGTAEPNTQIEVALDGGEPQTVSVDENGNWNTEFTGVTPGDHVVTATDGESSDEVDFTTFAGTDDNTADNTEVNTAENTEVNTADNDAENTEVNTADNSAENTEVNTEVNTADNQA
ncbi:MAG: choice-of-anchor G family protein, partial [Micrococcaceae bacterium]